MYEFMIAHNIGVALIILAVALVTYAIDAIVGWLKPRIAREIKRKRVN